jgi:tetratricopeptide (TPR) repeat protein
MITNAQKKALIIGISDYTDPRLKVDGSNLNFCRNDGERMYEVLKSQNYNISEKNKIVGEANWEKVRNTIYDFFVDDEGSPDDTLLFYYSGHGVLDDQGNIYLALSDTDPQKPYIRGYSFGDLTMMIERTISTRVIVILDCCYSGSAKLGKGSEEDAARKWRRIMEERSNNLREQQQRHVKCILAAGLSHQEAYALKQEEHSVFTKYLLKGLKGEDNESIDSEGNVTPQSLSNYVYIAIKRLPSYERPHQDPVIITEGSAKIILASYPKLKPLKIEDTRGGKKRTHSRKTKISITVGISAVISVVFALALFNQQMLTNEKIALYDKGAALVKEGNYAQAIQYLNKSLAIDPNFKDAINVKEMLSDQVVKLYTKGDTLYRNGNYTEAIKYFDKVLAIDPNYVDALEDKGLTLNNMGKYKEAIIYLNRSLAINSNDPFALKMIGWALDGLGNYTEAIKYLNTALDLDPKDIDALNSKGWALNGLRNYTGAITYLNKALKKDPIPSYGHALSLKGWALNGLRNYTGAIEYSDKALAIDPKNVRTLYNKSVALDKLGNHTGAIEYFDKAMKIDPKLVFYLKHHDVL